MQIEAAANKKTIWMEYYSLALYFSANERGTFSVSKVVPNVWSFLLTLKDVNPTILVLVIFYCNIQYHLKNINYENSGYNL